MRRPPVEAVVIGGSAGSIEALLEALPRVPAELTIPIVVLVHLLPRRPSQLTDLFGPRLAVPAREPFDKEPVAGGVVWFAPADYHLLVEHDHTFALSCDEPVHFSRPSIDVLFETAAEAYGPSLLGVLLSGANRDGVQGLDSIRRAGGATVVQSPRTASAPLMPAAGLAEAHPDHACSPRRLGSYLAAVARASARSPT